MKKKQLNIIGTRGVPAAHGGFETFAHFLSLYLVENGWKVNVYCQDTPGKKDGEQDDWNGVTRTHFNSKRQGPAGTIEFDYGCVRHVLKEPGIDLVLGYNTAIFCILQRLRGRRIVMNMDGIEWKRSKWPLAPKIWFFLNELIGANLCHVPVADHPDIARHVTRRTFRTPVMIPYGAPLVEEADASHILPLGLTPDHYLVSIARIEPENSLLELVRSAKILPDGFKAVILGRFDDTNPYHNKVRAAASDNVIFAGAIYDPTVVSALRFHARAYLHGHQVGGTNPSLVEALGAGNVVLAHDNKFNRWTAGPDQFYFSDEQDCQVALTEICAGGARVDEARSAAKARHTEAFQWNDILRAYEDVLLSELEKTRH